ncbi:MAG: sugar kinase [Deltaproteobacteria bacterium]|nr:sugar kinase [Deltaproteobacteria bacterium]
MRAVAAPRRLAVIGHVEHVTLGTVAVLPQPGDIVHLEAPMWFPGGGGGITFFQLLRSPVEIHLFTAIGNDDAGAAVANSLAATRAVIHAARRDQPHTRDLVLVTPDGERTILVVGVPLHTRLDDPLPWDVLASCDAVYFAGQDPDVLRAARAARILIVTARRRAVLARAGVRADVVVGSAHDPLEASALVDYSVEPGAIVMTEGGGGGRIETTSGVTRFPAAPPPARRVGSYGAGDSFVGALTWFLACGLPLAEACGRAAVHGAAVLAGWSPLEVQLALAVP